MSEFDKDGRYGDREFTVFSILISSFLAFASDVPSGWRVFELNIIKWSFYLIAIAGLTLIFVEKFLRDFGIESSIFDKIHNAWFNYWNWVIAIILAGLVSGYGTYVTDSALFAAGTTVSLLLVFAIMYFVGEKND